MARGNRGYQILPYTVKCNDLRKLFEWPLHEIAICKRFSWAINEELSCPSDHKLRYRIWASQCSCCPGFQSTRTLTKSYHANLYPSQLLPNTNFVPWPTRTYYQLVPKPSRTQCQLVPNSTMYITKRSTVQAKKVKVDLYDWLIYKVLFYA